ncbi:chorismate synthase [Clostridium sp. B9]|uniref:chorismate synthase n=1 Tax=Clostridium sp. B9 TaxID=3423224 RepID=UPI003D2F26FF
MGGVWGNKIKLSIFGESHGEGIGIVIDGIEPGITINMENIEKDMERRAPGRNSLSTQRKEGDKPEILSGIFNGITTGAPISMIIRNTDKRSRDYSKIKDVMRPGHADFPGYVRYNGFNDYRGGGHFSGRITAPLVFAGALAKEVLKEKGIFVGSHIKQVGKVKDSSFDSLTLNKEDLVSLLEKELPLIDSEKIDAVKEEITSYRMEGDSIGGIVECGIIGLKAGVGNPFFDSLESNIAHLAFSVPAVKGIEFGVGFDFANMKGSEANDEYFIEEKKIKTYSNNNGGITGGISNGMPVIFRVVIKPTPSISKEQRTVNISTMENETLSVTGRHDPCIVQRALVVIESIAALSVLELLNY